MAGWYLYVSYCCGWEQLTIISYNNYVQILQITKSNYGSLAIIA